MLSKIRLYNICQNNTNWQNLISKLYWPVNMHYFQWYIGDINDAIYIVLGRDIGGCIFDELMNLPTMHLFVFHKMGNLNLKVLGARRPTGHNRLKLYITEGRELSF